MHGGEDGLDGLEAEPREGTRTGENAVSDCFVLTCAAYPPRSVTPYLEFTAKGVSHGRRWL